MNSNESIVKADQLRAGDVVRGLVRDRIVCAVEVDATRAPYTYVRIHYVDGSRDSGFGHLPMVVRLDWCWP